MKLPDGLMAIPNAHVQCVECMMMQLVRSDCHHGFLEMLVTEAHAPTCPHAARGGFIHSVSLDDERNAAAARSGQLEAWTVMRSRVKGQESTEDLHPVKVDPITGVE